MTHAASKRRGHLPSSLPTVLVPALQLAVIPARVSLHAKHQANSFGCLSPQFAREACCHARGHITGGDKPHEFEHRLRVFDERSGTGQLNTPVVGIAVSAASKNTHPGIPPQVAYLLAL